jgi:hypothetical protein
MWKRKIAQVAVGAGSLVLVASLFTGDAGAAPTRSSYNLQVGAICRGYQEKAQTVGLGLSAESTTHQLMTELKSVIPAAQTGIAKMKKIPRPKNDGHQLNAVFSTQKTELNKFKKLAKDIQENKDKTARVIMEYIGSQAAKLQKQYNEAGLTECAVATSATSTTP